MTAAPRLFFAAPPGLEPPLATELAALGLTGLETRPGGVEAEGGAAAIMRGHLWSRGASRVLMRLGEARITHLAQLDKWARRLPWSDYLAQGARVAVEAVCRRSRIYHSGAAAERVETALRATLGPVVDTKADAEPPLQVLVRIEKDLCAVSLDLSGAPLHKRGAKQDAAKAPLRETMAALFLRQCGYTGAEPVVDPMCGSGTFILEAAEIASRLAPGRARPFAFERLRGFDAAGWAALKAEAAAAARAPCFPCLGFDRDAGAIAASRANAERAGLHADLGPDLDPGLGEAIRFEQGVVSNVAPPQGLPPGLVMVNPPYGERIGDKSALRALYGALGRVLKERFSGWRVGLVTSEPALARAAGLPFAPPGPPIPHGALKVRLYRAGPLP